MNLPSSSSTEWWPQPLSLHQKGVAWKLLKKMCWTCPCFWRKQKGYQIIGNVQIWTQQGRVLPRWTKPNHYSMSATLGSQKFQAKQSHLCLVYNREEVARSCKERIVSWSMFIQCCILPSYVRRGLLEFSVLDCYLSVAEFYRAKSDR